MIPVRLPDGRTVNINTDDPEQAKIGAAKYYNKTRQVQATDLEESEVSSTGDVFRGIGAGAVSAVEGLATLPWEAYDAIVDPEQSKAEEVRKFYEKLKPTTSTGAGEAAKFITQFALPGTVASKIAKARKLGKFAEVAAFAGTDFAVATQDVETLGDFFDMGPTSRTATADLEGSERAAAELGNRLKVAGESAAILLTLPKAFGLAGQGIGMGLKAAGDTGLGKAAAQKVLKTFGADAASPVGSAMTKVGQDTSGPIKKLATKYFTFQGDMPDNMSAQIKAQKIHEMSSINNELSRNMNGIDSSLNALSKAGVLNGVDDRVALNAINDYLFNPDEVMRLRGEKALKNLDEKVLSLSKDKKLLKPKTSLFESSKFAREQIDGLSKRLSSDGVLDQATQQGLIDTIDGNMKFYGTRMYRALKDPTYIPTPEQSKAAINELLQISKNSAKPLDERGAYNILNEMMLKKDFSSGGMKPNMQFEEETLQGMTKGILKGRKLDTLPALRDFLGEYTGAENIFGRIPSKDGTYKIRTQTFGEQKEGLMTKVKETTEGVAKMITKNNMFKDIDNYNKKLGEVNPGSEFIVDELPLGAPPGSYVPLGNFDAAGKITDASMARYGPVAGKYIKKEYAGAFDNAADLGGMQSDSFASNLWSTFLGIKGFSQMAKTVYSPTTQIRNATTAAFFTMMSGNVGNSKALLDSMQTVFSEIGDKYISVRGARGSSRAELKKAYDEYTQLGVVNTNVRQGEFESIIKDALENKIGSKFLSGKPMKLAEKAQNNFATKVYQGSDDVWKIYNFEMELGKLNKVLEKNPNAVIPVTDYRNVIDFGPSVRAADLDEAQLKVFLKREAASITKDLIPNYVRVPEFIKTLRKLPVGNFIAFPAEIIRTSGNVMGRAIKEVASESPEMREIGMRRLAGMATVNYAAGRAISTLGHTLTGSTEEQTEAFKRSYAASWDKNSQLIPIATDKDGNVTEFYNYSYTNPYDYLTRPFRGVFNAVNNGITSEQELGQIALDAATESGREFFGPFVSETMVGEKVVDLMRNSTSTGRPVWNEGEPLGDKMMKGFGHLAEGVVPTVSPYDFGRGRVKDLPRSLLSATGIKDESFGLSTQGVKLDAAGELADALSGLKTVRPVIENSLRFRAYEAGSQIGAAASIFNKVATQRGKVEAEEITKAYLTSNRQRFKALRDLNMAIEDARTLGMSEGDIAKVLKKAKTVDYKRVMAGVFSPKLPSKQITKEAYRSDENKISNPFDFEAIREVNRGFINKPLRPEAFEERQQQMAQPPSIMPPPMPGAVPPPSPPPPQSLFNRGIEALRDIELDKLMGS
tara:strand:- start:1293 stop:5258 length:3966 start_codon:yes stop_codon:yes gene_type:complete